MKKRIFEFLTKNVLGLFILVNLFFIAGLVGATGGFLGGLFWFVGNVVLVYLSHGNIPLKR